MTPTPGLEQVAAPFAVGDIVETIKGAKFWGEVRAIIQVSPLFDGDNGLRCGVYAVHPEFAGVLHWEPASRLRRRPALPSAVGDGLEQRLRERLGGIDAPGAGTDNLAIALATYYDDGSEPNKHPNWSDAAIDGSQALLDAIHGHYATALEALRASNRELGAKLAAVTAERDELRVAQEEVIDWCRAKEDTYNSLATTAHDGGRTHAEQGHAGSARAFGACRARLALARSRSTGEADNG